MHPDLSVLKYRTCQRQLSLQEKQPRMGTEGTPWMGDQNIPGWGMTCSGAAQDGPALLSGSEAGFSGFKGQWEKQVWALSQTYFMEFFC